MLHGALVAHPHRFGMEVPPPRDAELALTGNAMFRKDRRERRGGGVILYIKKYIQAYEITLKSEADCEEAIWCNIVTRNSTLTIGIFYRSPNIGHFIESFLKI